MRPCSLLGQANLHCATCLISSVLSSVPKLRVIAARVRRQVAHLTCQQQPQPCIQQIYESAEATQGTQVLPRHGLERPEQLVL